MSAITDEHRAKAVVVRDENRRARAHALASVATGACGVADVLVQASTNSTHPLRGISLRNLLLAQPGFGERSAAHVYSRLAASLRTPLPARVTVGWLVDTRARGRVAALADAITVPGQAWPGFPYTSQPESTSPQRFVWPPARTQIGDIAW